MLDPKEIDFEIARWEYLDSSYENYSKLADLYIIRSQMQKTNAPDYSLAYSDSPSSDESRIIAKYGDSDFLQAVTGKDQLSAWSVMDDLMDTLHTVNPRVYDGVMRKINAL